MKITFLGTGTSQGVPIIGCKCDVCTSLDFRDKRLRSSVLIEQNNTNIVIDTGPDFRQQMLRENVQQLDAVLFTHEHKDHVGGLDEVRAFNHLSGKYMPIYARPRVMEHLEIEYGYAFQEIKYPGVPLLTPYIIGTNPMQVGNVEVTPLEVMHHKLEINAFRIGNFTYVTDANFIAETEMDKMRGSEIMVLNGLQKEHHISHYTLAEALEVLAELKPKKAYLTHISHRLGKHNVVSRIARECGTGF